MIEGHLSINEIATEWEVVPRAVRGMCAMGKIGRHWLVPVRANQPIDQRVKPGAYIGWRNREE